MDNYNGLADEHYVNLNLTTELDLPGTRDTLLHFFEQLRKRFPTMRNFYRRDRGDFVLEEDKDGGSYRWATVEQKRISSGYVNPPDTVLVTSQHEAVLESIPYSLSVSPLDCESLNYMLGFDFNFCGNQHELLANALGIQPAFEPLTRLPGARIVSSEPSIQLALEDDCRTQCRLNVETRTSAYQIRTGEYPTEQISVYLTLRRYGSLDSNESFVSELRDLKARADELMQSYVIDNVLQPLQQAISIS
ncbi:MAG: hypothetical protein AAF456_16935 [Planctomycetota bacterium]